MRATLDEYLQRLAKAPDDVAFAAVFSDWLSEQGDSRGEAIALELKGDRRRLEALRKKHARAWLGPLADQAEVDACVFRGGFPVKLAFKRGASLEGCVLPPTVQYLAADWRALPKLVAAPPGLEVLEVTVGLGMAFSDFRALAAELDLVAPLRTETLFLTLDSFAGAEAAEFLAEGFLRSGLAERKAVGLKVRQGSLDAACRWLYRARQWGGGDLWGASWGGVTVTLSRDGEDRFHHVLVDLSEEDDKPIAARAGSAAAVLSQLGRLTPTRVDVRVPEGQRVGKKLRETLLASRRFLPALQKFRVTRKK